MDTDREDSHTVVVIDLTLDNIVGTTGSLDDIADLRTTSTLIEATVPSGDPSIPVTLSIVPGGVLVLKDPATAQSSTVGERDILRQLFHRLDINDRDDDAAPPADVQAAKLRMQNNVTKGCEQLTEELWLETADFFGINSEKFKDPRQKHVILGMKKGLLPYQLFAVFFMIKRECGY
ncbi:hypothetical protein BJ546DRAFT_1082088 [Cryomyces antarcticus]